MTIEEHQGRTEEAVSLGEDAESPQISVSYKTQHREQTAHRAKTSVKEKAKSASEAKLRLVFRAVSSP